MALGLLLVRVVVGALFVGHGTQKLLGGPLLSIGLFTPFAAAGIVDVMLNAMMPCTSRRACGTRRAASSSRSSTRRSPPRSRSVSAAA